MDALRRATKELAVACWCIQKKEGQSEQVNVVLILTRRCMRATVTGWPTSVDLGAQVREATLTCDVDNPGGGLLMAMHIAGALFCDGPSNSIHFEIPNSKVPVRPPESLSMVVQPSTAEAILCIRVQVPIDVMREAELRKAFERAREKAKFIIVDFEPEVTVSSTALGILMTFTKQVRSSGGEIAVVCASGSYVGETLSVMKLDKAIDVFPDVYMARDALAERFPSLASVETFTLIQVADDVAVLRVRRRLDVSVDNLELRAIFKTLTERIRGAGLRRVLIDLSGHESIGSPAIAQIIATARNLSDLSVVFALGEKAFEAMQLARLQGIAHFAQGVYGAKRLLASLP